MTFTGDRQFGDVPDMTVNGTLLTGFKPEAVICQDGERKLELCKKSSIISVKGNELGGEFELGFGKATAAVPFDASVTDLKRILEDKLKTGAVAITRTKADGQRGHTWTIAFTEKLGPQSPFVPKTDKLTGVEKKVTVITDAGTSQASQKIIVKTDGDDSFALKFKSYTTNKILVADLRKSSDKCGAILVQVGFLFTNPCSKDHMPSSPTQMPESTHCLYMQYRPRWRLSKVLAKYLSSARKRKTKSRLT